MSDTQASAPEWPTKMETIGMDAPWGWLAAGWRDLWTRPTISVAYGVGIAVVSFGIVFGLFQLEVTSLMLVVAGGFMLLGPLLAVGLYEKSRRLQTGEPIHGTDIALVATRSPVGLAFMGALLLVIYMFWFRLAYLLFALFFGHTGIPQLSEFIPTLLFSPQGLGLLVVGSAFGAVLAGFVFAITAVSVPMMMVRPVDTFTAIVSSMRACATNPKPMLLWAGLIAGLSVLGIVTLFLGLIVTFPLLGHATWHAYRELVDGVPPSSPLGSASSSSSS